MSRHQFGDIIGHCPQMRDIFRLINQVSPTEDNVLITGNTGTGKELVAKEIHRRSKRCKGPFVAVNCSAIPEGLLESEFFGHERGAFTGAIATKRGKFEIARGGTLFLDEIGSMSAFCQSKILRVLEERTMERVGGRRQIPVDCRIVSATSINLEQAIERNTFRSDLFYRIDELCVELPDLADRLDDLPYLVKAFLLEINKSKGAVSISAEAMHRLYRHEWPGNIRELRNTLKKASFYVKANDAIQEEHLMSVMRRSNNKHAVSKMNQSGSGLFMTLEEIEKQHIIRALQVARHNKVVAAKMLDIERKTLYNKIEKYGIDLKVKRRLSIGSPA